MSRQVGGRSMQVMYIRHKLGALSPLLPDEALVCRVNQPRAVITRCARIPNIWTCPFVASLSACVVCVTDRRVLVSCCVLPSVLRQELDLWFAGRASEERVDTIVAASLESGRWGPCVEIHSIDPARKHRFHSAPELTTRVYCEEAEEMTQTITDLAIRNCQQGDMSNEYR
jgi:hypothetical protein